MGRFHLGRQVLSRVTLFLCWRVKLRCQMGTLAFVHFQYGTHQSALTFCRVQQHPRIQSVSEFFDCPITWNVFLIIRGDANDLNSSYIDFFLNRHNFIWVLAKGHKILYWAKAHAIFRFCSKLETKVTWIQKAKDKA